MQQQRYSRQERFKPLGIEGQKRISAARVAIAGCGALGTVHAESLARAGVGTLRIIDRDFVEFSNLHRQFLFSESDAADAVPKAIAAARRIAQINSTIHIEPIVADLAPSNADELFEGIDLILDGTDNFETRYLINDWAVQSATPWIYGAAVGSYGLVMPVIPATTACLACVYPEPPSGAQPTCETEGVIGPLTATIAAMQSALALQILATGGNLAGEPRITTVDLWTGIIRQVREPAPDPNCPVCGPHHEFRHLNGMRRAPISLCGRNAVQIHDRARPINLAELAARLNAADAGHVRANEFALRLTLPAHEMTVFPDGRAIVKGTTDVGVARSMYSRYIGN
ncbi:MAG TPA: ThiF family adenylyltransferase [Bryobacteraceae bacterium]|jgi:adenylyltransferase/sulfurtransferase